MATPAQEPSPSNARPLPQEESGGLCCSHTMHFLEGNQLFPHLLSNSLALPLSSQHFIPTGLAVLEGVFHGMKITSPQNLEKRKK